MDYGRESTVLSQEALIEALAMTKNMGKGGSEAVSFSFSLLIRQFCRL